MGKEYIGLSCNFCGFQCYKDTGFFGGVTERKMYRCPECGTVLCHKCIDGGGLFSDPKCTKCGSKLRRISWK